MISRNKLSEYLQSFLACNEISDYAPNGLQVEGRETIKRIATAVTASENVILKAQEYQADALLVHHGFFWRGEEAVICGMKYRRISSLIKNDINLFAYHLPLDCHTEIGNNACIAHRLNITDIQTHRAGKVEGLLWTGLLPTPLKADELHRLIETQLDKAPLHIPALPQTIRRVAWCTGAAQDFIEQAYELGAQAYLSGEISERTYYQAQELGIHYFACGHHASERYGIQALGEHLSHSFDLEHQFIDTDNPV